MTHTISGGRRSFVDKDIIDDVDILVVVIDIHIIFNGIIDIYIHVDIENITIEYPETHYLGITSSYGGRTTCGQATPRIVPSYTSG